MLQIQEGATADAATVRGRIEHILSGCSVCSVGFEGEGGLVAAPQALMEFEWFSE